MKRARWDGPGTVNVYLPGDIDMADPVAPRNEGLQPGQLLPTETIGGEPVPASLRDELLARGNWSEVNQPDQTKKADEADDKKKGES